MRKCDYRNCNKPAKVYLESVDMHYCWEHYVKVIAELNCLSQKLISKWKKHPRKYKRIKKILESVLKS